MMSYAREPAANLHDERRSRSGGAEHKHVLPGWMLNLTDEAAGSTEVQALREARLGKSGSQASLGLLEQPPQANINSPSSGAPVHRNRFGGVKKILSSHSKAGIART
jgi:hypothetical protein